MRINPDQVEPGEKGIAIVLNEHDEYLKGVGPGSLDQQLKDTFGEAIEGSTYIAARLASASLANRLGPIDADPLPPISDDLPTVTWSTSATLTGRVESPLSENITTLGRRGDWNTTYNVNAVGALYSGRDFFLDGDALEVSWRELSANGARFHIFVDGAPITATPYEMGVGDVPSTASGSIRMFKLVWGTSKRRRITIYSSNIYGWFGFRVPFTATITPAPPLPIVAVVGDSFCAGSAATQMLLSLAVMLGRFLGVDVINASYHPEPAGALALAQRIALELRKDFAAL